ncbi:MAG: hypothetical protein US24_C0035G0005 [candidate division WS6 bacterium GW2011_GWC2_36_7]|uniref:Uncharacterized protein n=1 Tax=candidate division WS6 bacterium GW2011_GWC2_36_7 TaxID=1619091 RepID=A0A0G0EWA6_9BACT|nr:MAG: hypothetical protein US24_C0035G0005 [candidate division WS6 bacterium GW2011_GWC2_36_7]HAM37507.1 hypothetical protein [Patescibacteria group bacterium]
MDTIDNAKEDYSRIQEEKVNRGGEDFRFPIAGEMARENWEKTEIPVGTLMNLDDLQLYVGNPGEFSYDIWKQTGTSQASEVAKHWDTIKNYLPSEQLNRINNISDTLSNLVIYNQQIGEDYPLFILRNQLLLPYTTGHMIDGNNRLISLLRSLRSGTIQERTPIPVWQSTIPTALLIPYNIATFCTDKKPLKERIALLKERTPFHQLI